MRTQWVTAFLCALVSMGLVVMLMGQNQVMNMLAGSDTLATQLEKLNKHMSNLHLFEDTVKNLLTQADKTLIDLETVVKKDETEVVEKRNAANACQAEKKTKDDELAAVERQLTETEAQLKPESEAWNQELAQLRAQLQAVSPVCNYVRQGTLAGKLCNNTQPTS